MKILLVSREGAGAWFVWWLAHGGHSVDWVCCAEKSKDSLRGIIPPPLEHVRNPEQYDLIAFDQTDLASIAEQARYSAPIIGDSRLATKLENDRISGLELMEHAGIRVPPWEAFDSPAKAAAFVRKNRRRYVLKPCGSRSDSAASFCAKSDTEMVDYLERYLPTTGVTEFILQEFVQGTEVAVDGYFNGQDFYALGCTLEEKKFMPGGIGPNTGCAGNLYWLIDRNALYAQGLGRAVPTLRELGYNGPLDLNTIATPGALYGLEWTPRWGYEGTCNLVAVLPIDFADFLHTIAIGGSPQIGSPRHRFAATVRLSIPPYPNRGRVKPVPISGIPDDLSHFFLFDVRRAEGGGLETGDREGALGCPIGCGPSIRAAFGSADAMISRLTVPNLQYRNDIERCCARRYAELERQGWLRPAGPVS